MSETLTTRHLSELARLIRQDAHVLLARWRMQVRQLPSAQHLDVPTLNDHIPAMLEELARALEERSDGPITEAPREGSPPAHGVQRLQDGFDIIEVVAEYNILRGCVHDLADDHHLRLQGEAFHILNRVLDSAIGLAVESYAKQSAMEVQQRREEYLTFVAHDLRTPLNAISLATQLLEVTLPGDGADAEGTRMIRTLHRNVAQLDALVKKVLEENANLQAEDGVKLQRRHLDLWPLVEALVQDLKPMAAAGSARLINIVAGDMVVFADAGLLRRIFQNLIVNAIRYSSKGGDVCVGGLAKGTDGTIECWVSDTGSGIPADQLDKVFEKGESDPEHPESLGLGLAIVKTFVEAHGGTVQVESAVGQGSTFTFVLPPVGAS